MKKNLLTLLIILSLAVCFTGCAKTATNVETDGENTATEEPMQEDNAKTSKKSSKIDVRNLTETSVPIGISETSVSLNDSSDFDVSLKITNNNDEYEETSVSIDLEVLNSSGAKVVGDTIKTNRALTKGETYVYKGEIWTFTSNLPKEEVYTLKVIGIEIEDGTVAEQKVELEAAIRKLSNQLDNGEYNMAQLTWEDITETYGADFPKEIQTTEAVLKDEGYNPDNLSAGPKSNEPAESTPSPTPNNG